MIAAVVAVLVAYILLATIPLQSYTIERQIPTHGMSTKTPLYYTVTETHPNYTLNIVIAAFIGLLLILHLTKSKLASHL